MIKSTVQTRNDKDTSIRLELKQTLSQSTICGKTPTEYIQLKVIDLAKEKIVDNSKAVSEIAYELGFKYPQHFTRAFKEHRLYTQ